MSSQSQEITRTIFEDLNQAKATYINTMYELIFRIAFYLCGDKNKKIDINNKLLEQLREFKKFKESFSEQINFIGYDDLEIIDLVYDVVDLIIWDQENEEEADPDCYQDPITMHPAFTRFFKHMVDYTE